MGKGWELIPEGTAEAARAKRVISFKPNQIKTNNKKPWHLNILYPSSPSLSGEDPEFIFSCWGWWHLALWVLSSLRVLFSLKGKGSAVWGRRGDHLVGFFRKYDSTPGSSFAYLDKTCLRPWTKASSITAFCFELVSPLFPGGVGRGQGRGVSAGKIQINWPHFQWLSFSPSR